MNISDSTHLKGTKLTCSNQNEFVSLTPESPTNAMRGPFTLHATMLCLDGRSLYLAQGLGGTAVEVHGGGGRMDDLEETGG